MKFCLRQFTVVIKYKLEINNSKTKLVVETRFCRVFLSQSTAFGKILNNLCSFPFLSCVLNMIRMVYST